MRNIFCSLLCALLLLQSCNNKAVKIPEKTAFKKSPMDSVYSRLRPAIQYFNIDNSKATVIKAANGTEVMIPAGAFVNGSGNSVTHVQVEIVEAFSLQDFVTSGLATLSGNKLLISNGMMYINAKAGDEPLQVNKDAALAVSMPTMDRDYGDFQFFTGDGSDWTVDTTMLEEEYAITLPLDLLYPEGNKYIWQCIQSNPDSSEKFAYLDTSIVTFTDKKYEGTVIATGEFARRTYALMSMMTRMSYFINRDYYFDSVDCFGEKNNYDIWKVYYDDPTRSFKGSDSMAKKMYIDYFEANKDKLAAFCDEVNKHKQNYFSNWTDTNFYFDFRKTSLKEDYMSVLKYFPPANTKEIKAFNDHGVNLDAANAYDLLKEKGVAQKEINDLLVHAFRKRAIIKYLQSRKDAIINKQKMDKLYESTVFSVRTLGWINCDRFYDDPDAAKAEMYVSNTSANNFDFIDCSLVIPDMNVRLTGYPAKGGTYSFTQQNGVYTKLPIGKEAVVVGVSMQHDSLFFASKKIKIKDGLAIGLNMRHTTVNGLKDSLVLALKNK